MESYLILLGKRGADEKLFADLLRDWSYESGATGEPVLPGSLHASPEALVTPPGREAPDTGATTDVAAPCAREPGDLKSRGKAARKRLALEMLRECGGNRRQAAARLGVSYNTLWRILGEPEA